MGSVARRCRPAQRLPALHKAHAHPADRAHGLAGQAFGAIPGAEAWVVIARLGVLYITVRAPAVLVFGTGQFGRAAQLRTAGEAARKIHLSAITERGEN